MEIRWKIRWKIRWTIVNSRRAHTHHAARLACRSNHGPRLPLGVAALRRCVPPSAHAEDHLVNRKHAAAGRGSLAHGRGGHLGGPVQRRRARPDVAAVRRRYHQSETAGRHAGRRRRSEQVVRALERRVKRRSGQDDWLSLSHLIHPQRGCRRHVERRSHQDRLRPNRIPSTSLARVPLQGA